MCRGPRAAYRAVPGASCFILPHAHSPPRRRRARRLGLRHLRVQQPAVRPRNRTGVACRAGRVPDVRRRPEPGRHRADPPHARDRGGPGSVLHGGRARAALPGHRPARRCSGPRGRQSHPTASQAPPARPARYPRRARVHARDHRRRDGACPAYVPSPPRVSQPVRHRRHAAVGLHRVRMDVRRVGLGCPCTGRGDPPAGGSQAAARGDHPAARRRRVRRRWRPPPHRGRAPGHHRGRARRGLPLPPARGARQVNARRWRWVWWLAGLGGAGLALKFFVGFPWRVTFAALLDASPWLLAVAFVVNLSSLVAKGWAWHLILKPVAPHSWRAAQEANLVGAAVNNLAVAVVGEAARVRVIAQRGGVPVGAAVSSVVWTRVAEALALALFLVMAPSVLQLEPWLRVVQVAAGLALGVVVLLAWARGWAWLAAQLPAKARSRLAVHGSMGKGGRLFVPTLLGLWNWGTQWATYHLVLQATHLRVTPAASFTALIAANLSGLLRPTPANVGITQAALVVGLLPFDIAPEQAVAAGLALQGLQVFPVLALGATVTGWRLLKLEREIEEEKEARKKDVKE